MARSKDEGRGSPPNPDTPAKASPPPDPKPPTSPEHSTDVHGDPETPV